MIAVFDLDGTVIDSSHRALINEQGAINLDNWRKHTRTQILGDVELPLAQYMRDCIADPNVSCLLYTSPSPRDATLSRMPSSA